MGKRSISTTKTGKFMNPTDQARKEARRKELKKNKKQRLIVRQSVIKAKDPTNVLTELEALDRMEFDPNNPPPYNVKVIQDKRRKLRETWQKLFRFYEREDPKTASELRGLEIEYEKKKSQMMAIHESVKQAERVKLDDIPLPDAASNQAALALFHDSDMPMQPGVSQKGILKKLDSNIKRKPPGPPPGPPPMLVEFECEDDEKQLGITADENLKNVLNKTKKIRFSDDQSSKLVAPVKSNYPTMPPPPSQQQQMLSQQIPNYAAALKQNQSNYPINKQNVNSYGSVIPQQPQPPPPPLKNPQRIPILAQQQKYPAQPQQSPVLMAPPTRSLASASFSEERASSSATTIEAKPQLRNKMQEITRFLPTSLVVRRDTKSKPTQQRPDGHYNPYMQQSYGSSGSASVQQTHPKASTDEAYEQFMKEMEKIL